MADKWVRAQTQTKDHPGGNKGYNLLMGSAKLKTLGYYQTSICIKCVFRWKEKLQTVSFISVNKNTMS